MNQNIDYYIDRAEIISLTNDQIMKGLNNQTKIVKYTDLYTYTSIDDLLKPYNNVVILYQTISNTSGHWVCMFKNGNTLNFFDSYGLKVDEQIQYCPYLKRNMTNPYVLSDLLKNSNYDLVENTYAYQTDSKKQSPNTCGRFCIVRLLFRSMDNKQFFLLYEKCTNG